MPSTDPYPSQPVAVAAAAETAFETAAGARRNRLMALWAAEKMGLSPESSESYARALETYHIERPGEEDVIRKISGDLAGAGIAVREAEVRTRAAECLAQAREALKTG